MVTEKQEVAAEVVEVAQYDAENPHYGEFVRVQFAGEEQTRRYTLGKDLDRAALKVGAKVKLTFQSFLKPQGAKDGSGRVFYNEKRRVIAAVAAQ